MFSPDAKHRKQFYCWSLLFKKLTVDIYYKKWCGSRHRERGGRGKEWIEIKFYAAVQCAASGHLCRITFVEEWKHVISKRFGGFHFRIKIVSFWENHFFSLFMFRGREISRSFMERHNSLDISRSHAVRCWITLSELFVYRGVHPPGLRAYCQCRWVWWLLLPLPRIPLRRLGPD